MIKSIAKYEASNGEYRCGICGDIFPNKDAKGKYIRQRTYLKDATYLKFGNEPVAMIPKTCYRCWEVLKVKILDLTK
jgi:hypothetical protein